MTSETKPKTRTCLAHYLRRLLMYGASLAVLMSGSQAMTQASAIVGFLYLTALALLVARTGAYLLALARCLWASRREGE